MTKLDIDYSLTVWMRPSDFAQIRGITVTSGGNGNGFLVEQNVRLSEVWLELTSHRCELHYSYWGKKTDGSEHKRRTYRIVHFGNDDNQAYNWLRKILGPVRTRELFAIKAFWPTKDKARNYE